jgi:lethal(2) giant larvae protein
LFSYAVGTAHGFALFNYKQNRILTAKCTLDPNALGNTPAAPSSTGESTLIRGRSLKKSLRESFRRLRKGRTIKKATMLPVSKRADDNNPLSATNMHLEEVIRVPVERQVEFREFKPMDDQVISMVRCLYFAKTFLNSGQFHSILKSTDCACEFFVSSERSNVFALGGHQWRSRFRLFFKWF